METLLVRPKNKEQLAALKAFVEALRIPYDTENTDSPYDPAFVKKVVQGREDVKNGKGTKIAIADLWK